MGGNENRCSQRGAAEATGAEEPGGGHSQVTPTESTGQWHSVMWDVTALR